MSGSEDQGGAGRREVAYRLFAAEYDDADFSYSESDEERAPNYVVTPSGARVNRLFVVGVLTEVEQVNESQLRARVVDPTGAFVVYAGQYQPDQLAFLERADPPTFVALTGKARTFQPEDSETVYTSVRPESINEVDAETRDRWVVQTAEQTLHRIATMRDGLEREERGDALRDALVAGGVDEGLAAGVAMALEHYGTTPTYLAALRDTALDAARVVAGDLDEVDSLATAPDETGATTLADLRDLDSPVGDIDVDAGAAASTTSTTDEGAATETETTATSEATDDAGSTVDADATADAAAAGSTADVDGVSADDAADDSVSEPDTATTTGAIEADEESTADGTTVGSGSETTAGGTDALGGGEETAADVGTDDGDDLDDFDGGFDSGVDDDLDEELDEVGDFEAGEFELEEEERERIEEEFGTDFSTGTEVDEPGEADIDPPEPEPEAADQPDPATDADAETGTPETDTTGADPSEAEPATTEPDVDGAADAEPSSDGPATEDTTAAADSQADAAAESGADADTSADDGTDETAESAEPPEDVDPTEAVMETMRDMDDGDGADRASLVDTVAGEYGFDADTVDDAVQDALMDGQCYEPEEGRLKPI